MSSVPCSRASTFISADSSELSNLRIRPSLKPTVQLERIVASIQDLVDPEDLGHLQHFKSPRWNRLTPYEVNISPLPKEEAAQTPNSVLHTSTDEFTIYTDASSMPRENSTGVGVGLLVLNYDRGTPRVVYKSMTNLRDSQLVYNGELERTTQAVEYASKVAKPGQSYYIYSDNQPGQTCQIRAIQAAELAKNRGASISINWVPGHTGVYGNELADSLAKQATTLAPNTDETSFAVLGCKAKEVTTVKDPTALWN
ncbi:hypothetical protein DL98DRAFT_554737 [Cadophora sp. DSE1049]|nr:hypothetical protein DL98DRAFT_554737 [Cadophora sp. DSE1049]